MRDTPLHVSVLDTRNLKLSLTGYKLCNQSKLSLHVVIFVMAATRLFLPVQHLVLRYSG
jgi:hypothetical protein